MNILEFLGRNEGYFKDDLKNSSATISSIVRTSSFLVIGGAGSIGSAVVRTIFERNPKLLHVVDINENDLVECVRSLRSSVGYTDGEFRTFALDCGGPEFEALLKSSAPYDYVLNLSALKHVRSEKDPFTLMRMIRVNVLNSVKIARLIEGTGTKKYFCVSTDKAANPINLMGASKRLMECALTGSDIDLDVSLARFANVAFSNGSLLNGFENRYLQNQPMSAPLKIKRYFMAPSEAGELCLIACLLGENRDLLFPKLDFEKHQITFVEVLERYLAYRGYEIAYCESEEEARSKVALIPSGVWPVYLFESDTTGEKIYEEFHTNNEVIDEAKFEMIGIVKLPLFRDSDRIDQFFQDLGRLEKTAFDKKAILELFTQALDGFHHVDSGRYLDDRM